MSNHRKQLPNLPKLLIFKNKGWEGEEYTVFRGALKPFTSNRLKAHSSGKNKWLTYKVRSR